LRRVSADSAPLLVAIQKDPAKLDDPLTLRRALLDFIADFANWDSSTVREYLDTSRVLTQAAHEALGEVPGTKPLVVDPFAGGGAIPLEALRVGADAFASDLNPVAVLLNKVVLEYIPKYGQRLADEVRKWGGWIKREAEKELAEFYPNSPDGATPIAYLWARTIQCEGPGCGAEVPLIRSLWLAKKGRRTIALQLKVDRAKKEIIIEIVWDAKASQVGSGTTSGGAATCPVCGFTTPVERVRAQMTAQQGGSDNAKLLAVVTTNGQNGGRLYRAPSERDFQAVEKAKVALHRISATHTDKWFSVPNEPINHLRGFFNVVLYGMKSWGNLFTARQALTLLILADLIEKAPTNLGLKSKDGLVEAVQVCMALVLDKQADRNSAVCRWIHQNEATGYTFGRQALPMNWDFVEMSPLRASGAWSGIVRDTVEVIESQPIHTSVGTAVQSAAADLPLPDQSAHMLFTDPPYYSAVPYADLSDFFYVWLKRTLKMVLPELFAEPLSPKDKECVALSHRAAMYRNKNAAWFERQMGVACARARIVTGPDGIGCFVFANKETAGWEAMLNSIIDNGWVVSASWPIDTERPGRLRAQNSAALASSIHIICRPRRDDVGSDDGNEAGDWRDVLAELPRRIHGWMPRLAHEGVVGADAIFACLGPALEIFSRYSRVEKASGEVVTLKEYLEQVWAAVAKEALSLVFEGADTAGFEPDARLTAMWLWTLNAGASADAGTADEPDSDATDDEDSAGKAKLKGGFALEYDAARKIAQGLGAHLEELSHLVEIKGDQARLLPVCERTKHLFGKEEAQAPTRGRGKKKPVQGDLFADLKEAEEETGWGVAGAPKAGEAVLDCIHQSMILFAAGRGEALKRFLVEEGAGRDQRFWSLAQALSALYPNGTDEKRWVDGVLARKKSFGF
jgi:putative DNA methylase